MSYRKPGQTAIASSKCRSGFGWFMLGILFGPFSLVVALLPSLNLVLTKQQEIFRAVLDGKMKRCRACSEFVKAEAIKCRYCGEALPVAPQVVEDVVKCSKCGRKANVTILPGGGRQYTCAWCQEKVRTDKPQTL